MSIKSIALAATIAATGSVVSADTYFGFDSKIDSGSVLELGLITADADGVVEIYDYHTGTRGALLGTETINAGANADVRVNTRLSTTDDVLAVVLVNGEVVATKAYELVD